jgi:predicted PurR-regulated permease PerM
LYEYWQGLTHNTAKLLSELSDYGQYLLPAGEWLLGAAAILGQGTLQLAFALFIAFFFYRDGDDGAKGLQNVAHRLGGERAIRVLNVVGATIKSVVYGPIGTAIAQSALTSLGLWLAGVPGVLLLGFVTFLMALTPIGAPLVWFPAAIWLFYANATGWAVFLVLWGIFVVGGADNIIRPYFISRGSDLPLFWFSRVLGGTLAFGFSVYSWGPRCCDRMNRSRLAQVEPPSALPTEPQPNMN